MTVQYLIDSENVGDFWIPLLELSAEETELIVFYTRNSPHMSYDSLIRLKESDRTVTFIKCYEGTNALDFQLVSELGYRISKDEDGRFVIVTNDTGFDAAVKYWRRRKKSVKRITGKECRNLERRVREDLAGRTAAAHPAAASGHLYTEDEHDADRDLHADAVHTETVQDSDARPSRPNLRDAEQAAQPEPEETYPADDSGYDSDTEPGDADVFEYDTYPDDMEDSAYASEEEGLQEYSAEDSGIEEADSGEEDLFGADDFSSGYASGAEQEEEGALYIDAYGDGPFTGKNDFPLSEESFDDDPVEVNPFFEIVSNSGSDAQDNREKEDDNSPETNAPYVTDREMHAISDENGQEEQAVCSGEENASAADTNEKTASFKEVTSDAAAETSPLASVPDDSRTAGEETGAEETGAEEKTAAQYDETETDATPRSKSRRSRSRRSKSSARKHGQTAASAASDGSADADSSDGTLTMDASEPEKPASSAKEDGKRHETESADAVSDDNSAAMQPPGDEEIARIVACIGADNLAELHNQLATFYGDQGKDIYLSIKNNTRSLPVFKPDLKQKFAYYCEIIFSRSDYAEEYPSDISEFLLNVREKLNNLNSLRYALQKEYGKEKGRRFYFLLKPFAKTMYQM